MPEYRGSFGGEVRVSENDGKHLLAARVTNYDVEDTHGTVWAPGVFSESLRGKSPVMVWSHDWQRPIGKVTDHRDSSEGLDVIGEFADFDAVPDARMAHALLKSGIITQFSFGFVRTDGSNPGERGRITSAQLDEISPVLVGSVPGTKTLAVRSGQQVDRGVADSLLERVSRGEISAADALNELASVRSAPLMEVRSANSDTLAVARETFKEYSFEDILEDGAVVGVRAIELRAPVVAVEPDPEIRAVMSRLDSLIKTRSA